MKESERDLALRALAGMSAALGSFGNRLCGASFDLATLISFAGVVAPDAVVPLRSMGQQRLQRLIPWFFTGS